MAMTVSWSGMILDRIVIVDGYVDEPTCLGVPPYVSIYPRYIAGAIWTQSPSTEITYQTIDQIRLSRGNHVPLWQSVDLIILIAGMIVPGKYLGGTPISVKEAKRFFSDPRLSDTTKVLAGPWASFGCATEGGQIALGSEVLSPPFHYIITGDADLILSEMLEKQTPMDHLDLTKKWESFEKLEEFIIKGSGIVKLHPSYSRRHLICEIETYRGCPRYLTGGCSFCVEPLHGVPRQRTPESIAREVGALKSHGIRAFRLGRQADLFVLGSKEIGEEEFPKPEPTIIKKLFSSIRHIAPGIDVLHIDNVNPGTLFHHPEESRDVAKIIMKYHTTGDVAAFGVESFDPEVVKRNNLKADAEEILAAVRLLNEVGAIRDKDGMPHLLPGLNLLYGLPGESKKTLDINMHYLQLILNEGLLLRRINIRQVIGFKETRVVESKSKKIKRNMFFRHKEAIRNTIDVEMMKRVVPAGTVIRQAFLEGSDGGRYLLRPLGTYPLLCYMPSGKSINEIMNVMVVSHGPRSISVLPYPFNPKDASIAQWKSIPGLGAKRAARLMSEPLSSLEDIQNVLDTSLPDWLVKAIEIE